MIQTKRKSDKNRQSTELRDKYSKYDGYDEIFIVAKDHEQASKVDEWNTDRAKQLRKRRLNTIKKKGAVSDKDFTDNILDRQAIRTEQYVKNMKGK